MHSEIAVAKFLFFDQTSESSSCTTSSYWGDSNNSLTGDDESTSVDGIENWDDHALLDDVDTSIRIHLPILNFPGENQFRGRAPAFENVATTLGNGQCNCENFGINTCCLREPEFGFFYPDINIDEEMARERTEHSNPNHLNRKRLYRIIFHKVDPGTLGQRERLELPVCAVAKVRQLFPDESGFYMGFKEN